MNLLSETIEAISDSGHEIKDIIFIGSEESGYSCKWYEFQILADLEYDNGFGAPKVADDLIIVFSDGIKMWRNDYDGSEWWEFQTPFIMPHDKKSINSLFTQNVGWDDLAEINKKL